MPLVYATVESPEHAFPGHPERPERIPAILSALDEAGLRGGMDALEVRPAAREAILRCHDAGYVDALAEVVREGPGYVDPAPTYVTPSSFEDARRAAGAAVAVVDAVLAGAPAGLSLARPPGHHAVPDRAMGFCLLGNVAIAARHARSRGIERVMIVDFDVHHGNGTQEILYEDGDVLFVSTHQRGIYPGTGAEGETGAGDGAGATINVPLPAGAGDRALARVVSGIVRPAAARFRPGLVLVSAGFDGHLFDPLAGLQMTGPGYHALAAALADVAAEHAAGRIAFVLEGGYGLEALGNGVVNVVRALRGEGPDAALGEAPGPEPDVSSLVSRVRSVHGLG